MLRAQLSGSRALVVPWKLGLGLQEIIHRRMSSSSQSDKLGLLELPEVEKVLSDLKADDVRVIPVGNKCDWTDFMVIATGRSTWHVKNIAQALIYKVKQKQLGVDRLFLPSVQGQEGGNWIVIDSGKVIVHALDEKARAYYNLENLWTTEMPPKGGSNQLEVSMNVNFVGQRRRIVGPSRYWNEWGYDALNSYHDEHFSYWVLIQAYQILARNHLIDNSLITWKAESMGLCLIFPGTEDLEKSLIKIRRKNNSKKRLQKSA